MNIDALVHMDGLRNIAFSFPGITEAPCYGTPAFYVNKKLLARLKEDGLTLVIYTQDREALIKSEPDIYFVTDHYRNYPMMLVKLGTASQKELRALFQAAWQARAGKKLLKDYEKNRDL